ncbi:hypothetical protein GQ600_14955 [Phytophthora cactorum]|nr:hypothetical protein GQ600_14955 [Phytophthora cactorum]
MCVRVIFAYRRAEHVASNGRSILVIRDKRKRQELVTGPLGGRPCLVGPALTL